MAAAIFDQHSVDLLADHSHVQLEHEYTPAWSRLVGSVAPEAALFSELGVLSGREHSDWLNGYLKEKMKVNNKGCLRLTRNKWLVQQGLSPLRCDIQSSRLGVASGSHTKSLPSTILDKFFDIFRSQSSQDIPEEGALSLAVAVPLVGHVGPEAVEPDGLLPYSLHAELRP